MLRPTLIIKGKIKKKNPKQFDAAQKRLKGAKSKMYLNILNQFSIYFEILIDFDKL